MWGLLKLSKVDMTQNAMKPGFRVVMILMRELKLVLNIDVSFSSSNVFGKRHILKFKAQQICNIYYRLMPKNKYEDGFTSF